MSKERSTSRKDLFFERVRDELAVGGPGVFLDDLIGPILIWIAGSTMTGQGCSVLRTKGHTVTEDLQPAPLKPSAFAFGYVHARAK